MGTKLNLAWLVFAAALVCASTPCQAHSTTTLQTPLGSIVGVEEHGYRVFRGMFASFESIDAVRQVLISLWPPQVSSTELPNDGNHHLLLVLGETKFIMPLSMEPAASRMAIQPRQRTASS